MGHLPEIEGEVEAVGCGPDGIVQAGESNMYSFDIQLQTIGETCHRFSGNHLHFLMDVVVVGKLNGEVFDGFDFDAEDKVAEEIVGELRHFGRVLRFSCDGVGLDEGVVKAVVAHVPAVEGVEGDVVADGDVFETLREGDLQVEGEGFAVAGRVGLHLGADVFRQQGERQVVFFVVVAAGDIHGNAGGEVGLIVAEDGLEVGADGEVGGELTAPADDQGVVARVEFAGLDAGGVSPAKRAVGEPVNPHREAARLREGVGIGGGYGVGGGEIVGIVERQDIMLSLADVGGVREKQGRIVVVYGDEVAAKTHQS